MTENNIKSIFETCQATRDKAYAPYSRHKVGAVIMDTAGNFHPGCNVETAHYKGICAEGSAISKMVLSGANLIRDIYVMGPDLNVLCTPCGDCRQRIREFSDQNTRVHCFGPDQKVAHTFTMEELLPLSFGPENLHLD